MKCGTLLLAFFLFSCASPSQVSLKSTPEGSQVLVKTKDGETKDLGKTPLSLSKSEMFSYGSGVSALEFKKEGYESEKLVLADNGKNDGYDISVKLSEKKPEAKTDDQKNLEVLAKGLAKGLHFTMKKDLDKAQVVLEGLTQDYPGVSVCHDLLGNVFFLKHENNLALQSYEKSLLINPDNIETKQMVARLKKGQE
jgi:hypothetical protein